MRSRTCEADNDKLMVPGTCEADNDKLMVPGTCEADNDKLMVPGTCEAGNDKLMVPGTCEAGESIKPGAQAPGKRFLKRGAEPAKRATAHLTQGCRPFNGLQRLFFIADPGACAPGFMLPPASQVERPRIARPASQAM
jgi:hypothetical protein